MTGSARQRRAARRAGARPSRPEATLRRKLRRQERDIERDARYAEALDYIATQLRSAYLKRVGWLAAILLASLAAGFIIDRCLTLE